MPRPLTHLADDNLAVNDALESVFGSEFVATFGAKTSKTQCNKRASVASIVRSEPTCAACMESNRARVLARQASFDRLLELATNPATDAFNARLAVEILEANGIAV